MTVKSFLISVITFVLSLTAWSQGSTNRAYWAYIDKYKDLAMEQQQKYAIPASITLAQGLLESGAGRSRLATEANNHFGIKTPGGWTGPYIRVDDDRPNEKFRKYRTVRESYEDHSQFLLKPRYQRLFTYKTTDYKAWAKGLKACGYATSPTYAQSLIRIIEMYSLHQFDTRKPGKYTMGDDVSEYNARGKKGAISRHYLKRLSRNKVKAKKIPAFFRTHAVYHNNDNYFIVVQANDDLATISQATGISIKELLKFNDLDNNYTLTVGDILYLRKKKSKASKEYKDNPHIVQPGQSMYDIAQMYGIRLKKLYKINKLKPRKYQIEVGDTIRLR
jgi:LysM repeat protein